MSMLHCNITPKLALVRARGEKSLQRSIGVARNDQKLLAKSEPVSDPAITLRFWNSPYGRSGPLTPRSSLHSRPQPDSANSVCLYAQHSDQAARPLPGRLGPTSLAYAAPTNDQTFGRDDSSKQQVALEARTRA